eukprot:5188459-Pleurochrysis_carterae.AAC.1
MDDEQQSNQSASSLTAEKRPRHAHTRARSRVTASQRTLVPFSHGVSCPRDCACAHTCRQRRA